ncbi:hypothetical protein SASPL_130218 [Salvia splendens]|uniref:Uncharacterized protein n=1 Tax=Salvia splendens TaxID=180675 RepID=A0A8X8ZJF4_SALSN|nr:hypothetical protein SASPL_130218 [Salvia splendens]
MVMNSTRLADMVPARLGGSSWLVVFVVLSECWMKMRICSFHDLDHQHDQEMNKSSATCRAVWEAEGLAMHHEPPPDVVGVGPVGVVGIGPVGAVGVGPAGKVGVGPVGTVGVGPAGKVGVGPVGVVGIGPIPPPVNGGDGPFGFTIGLVPGVVGFTIGISPWLLFLSVATVRGEKKDSSSW